MSKFTTQCQNVKFSKSQCLNFVTECQNFKMPLSKCQYFKWPMSNVKIWSIGVISIPGVTYDQVPAFSAL